jgi:hypothetical protein
MVPKRASRSRYISQYGMRLDLHYGKCIVLFRLGMEVQMLNKEYDLTHHSF